MLTLNRAQQSYFFENAKFSSSSQDLEFGIPLETENYHYRIVVQPSQSASVLMTAEPLREGLRSYTGAVFAMPTATEGNQASAILCQAESAALVSMPAAPQSVSDRLDCPSGSEKVE